jgi:hypothetical protein
MTQQYKRRVEQVRSVRGSRQRAQAGLETDHSLSNVPTGLGAVDVQPDPGARMGSLRIRNRARQAGRGE